MPTIVRGARVTQSLRADNARDMVVVRDGGSLQQFVDSILMVREKPLPSGGLREDRRETADKIFAVLTSNVFLDGKARKEYSEGISQERKSVAKSFSRLIALYASYRGNAISEISPDLQKGLLELSRHLQTETSMLVEERIPQIYSILPKFSAFEVIEAKHELLNRYSDDKTVMVNLRTIIYSAINHSNLGMMLDLAAGASATKNKIEEQYGSDPVVMANLPTIIHAALGRGSLNLASELAEGASATKNKIEKQYKNDPVVMANLSTIINTALVRGSLNYVSALAKHIHDNRSELGELRRE